MLYFDKIFNFEEKLEKINAMTVNVEAAKKMSEEELEGKILTGVLVNKPREDYYTKYKRIIDSLAEKGEGK